MQPIVCSADGQLNSKKLNWLLPSIVIFTTVLAISYLSFFRIGPDDLVAVVFPPWIETTEAFVDVTENGGYPIRSGEVGTIIIAKYSDRKILAGSDSKKSWFFMSAKALGACLPFVLT